MTFMEQQVTHKMQWIQIDGNQGTTFVPAEDVAHSGLGLNESTDDETTLEKYADYYEGSELHTVGLVAGYGARLSAPGYMDCTEWAVFDTPEEAEDYLKEKYGDGEEE